MVRLLILGHGPWADGLLGAAELITGEAEAVVALGLAPDSTPEAYLDRVRAALGPDPARDTLLLVDMVGGTPANTALLLAELYGVQAVAGVNLPVLLELVMGRSGAAVEDLVATALTVGPKSVVSLAGLVDKTLAADTFRG